MKRPAQQSREPTDPAFHTRRGQAFTLVEILLVIAIIGVMSAIVLTTVGNATQDARLTVARQQQAAVQQALNAWIAAQISNNTLTIVRADYTNATTRWTGVSSYLNTNQNDLRWTNSRVESDVLTRTGRHLTFSAWTATNYPVVNLAP